MTGYNVEVRQYDQSDLPPVNEREVWRYSGCKQIPDESELTELMRDTLDKYAAAARPRVCFTVTDKVPFETDSKGLAKVIAGSSRVVTFAATVGIEYDRLIKRYQRIEPTRALFLQALGAERAEALCDLFCSEFEGRTPRYSPGYGDLPLEVQKDVFAVLKCESKIGISLNESLLMTPTKSVTALFGIKDGEMSRDGHDCSLCGLLSCEYRREE